MATTSATDLNLSEPAYANGPTPDGLSRLPSEILSIIFELLIGGELTNVVSGKQRDLVLTFMAICGRLRALILGSPILCEHVLYLFDHHKLVLMFLKSIPPTHRNLCINLDAFKETLPPRRFDKLCYFLNQSQKYREKKEDNLRSHLRYAHTICSAGGDYDFCWNSTLPNKGPFPYLQELTCQFPGSPNIFNFCEFHAPVLRRAEFISKHGAELPASSLSDILNGAISLERLALTGVSVVSDKGKMVVVKEEEEEEEEDGDKEEEVVVVFQRERLDMVHLKTFVLSDIKSWDRSAEHFRGLLLKPERAELYVNTDDHRASTDFLPHTALRAAKDLTLTATLVYARGRTGVELTVTDPRVHSPEQPRSCGFSGGPGFARTHYGINDETSLECMRAHMRHYGPRISSIKLATRATFARSINAIGDNDRRTTFAREVMAAITGIRPNELTVDPMTGPFFALAENLVTSSLRSVRIDCNTHLDCSEEDDLAAIKQVCGWLDARGLAGRAKVQLDGWTYRTRSDVDDHYSDAEEVPDLDPLLHELRSRCSDWVDNRAGEVSDASHNVMTFAVRS